MSVLSCVGKDMGVVGGEEAEPSEEVLGAGKVLRLWRRACGAMYKQRITPAPQTYLAAPKTVQEDSKTLGRRCSSQYDNNQGTLLVWSCLLDNYSVLTVLIDITG